MFAPGAIIVKIDPSSNKLPQIKDAFNAIRFQFNSRVRAEELFTRGLGFGLRKHGLCDK